MFLKVTSVHQSCLCCFNVLIHVLLQPNLRMLATQLVHNIWHLQAEILRALKEDPSVSLNSFILFLDLFEFPVFNCGSSSIPLTISVYHIIWK